MASNGIQPEEFICAVQALWAANATLTTNVPGNIWLNNTVPDEALEPYGVLNLEMDDPLLAANRSWIQWVNFEILIYSTASMDAAARAATNTAANDVFCANGVVFTMASGNKNCGAAMPKGAGTQVAESRKGGSNVVQTKMAYRVMTQGSF